MFKIFKPAHEHKWKLVACNDSYHTHYTDTNKKVYWKQRYYKCDCGARKHEDDRPSKNTVHEGLEAAKKNWIDAGVVPSNSYYPDEKNGFIKIDSLPDEKVDPIEKLNRNLEDLARVVNCIKRDYDLEAKYPKLKEAADEYNRRLDKYRNFENLKEK
jgi:hypothetical protein